MIYVEDVLPAEEVQPAEDNDGALYISINIWHAAATAKDKG